MGINDVYKYVARRIDGCTQGDVKTVLEVYADFVRETLTNSPTETVALPGIGKFFVKKHPARSGVTNFDGKNWDKPAWDELKFKVTSTVKEIK